MYAYDSLGRVVAAGDSSFLYSDDGLVRAVLGEGDVVEYTYDSVSNLISFNQGESHGRFTYDAHRRVTGIDTTARDDRVRVRPPRARRGASQDGVRTEYSYDQRGTGSSAAPARTARSSITSTTTTAPCSGSRARAE